MKGFTLILLHPIPYLLGPQHSGLVYGLRCANVRTGENDLLECVETMQAFIDDRDSGPGSKCWAKFTRKGSIFISLANTAGYWHYDE